MTCRKAPAGVTLGGGGGGADMISRVCCLFCSVTDEFGGYRMQTFG